MIEWLVDYWTWVATIESTSTWVPVQEWHAHMRQGQFMCHARAARCGTTLAVSFGLIVAVELVGGTIKRIFGR